MFLKDQTTIRGFTFIELMVTMAIIGVLTAVILASVNSVRMRARDAQRISDLNQLQLAVEAFYNRCGSYPESLALNVTNGDTCPGTTNLGYFISSIPRPPAGTVQTDYYYIVYRPTGYSLPVGYHLGAVLEITNHPALRDDRDFTSQNTTGWVQPGFYGNDPRYDLMDTSI